MFKQQVFPRCYTIPRITGEGDTIGLHTHTQSTPIPPKRKERRGDWWEGGREIADQKEEGRGKGSVNSVVGRL